MNTMGDYYDLYLKTDVLLLADTFEKFINACLNYYGLDPCYYFSTPGLSWHAMLRMTEIELELLSDIDMHLFIEKAMSGGIWGIIAKRQSRANNKHMKCYDNVKPRKYIVYLDPNNLYGYEMSHNLLYSEFKWLNKKEINRFSLNSLAENSSIGYMLEVDLDYPDDLHELHNDCPLAPEKLEISQSMFQKYCCSIAEAYGTKIGGVNKLITNLGNKNKYVLHYRNLQLYLSLGMKLTKVYRILKFKQSDWLKNFISFKTGERKNAANSFKKMLSQTDK